VVVAIGAVWFWSQVEPGTVASHSKLVYVEPGGDLTTLTKELSNEHIISSSLAFHIYLDFHSSFTLLPGIYSFRPGEGFAKIVGLLSKPPVRYRLTVTPGMRLETIAEGLSRDPGRSSKNFLTLATSGEVRSFIEPVGVRTTEGLIWPDTYYLTPRANDREILKFLLRSFDRMVMTDQIVKRAAELHESAYQAVIVASIVQAEAKFPVDQGKVARVVYNRLQKAMPLQMDSTVRYATGNYSSPLTYAQLHFRSPYNTYVTTGLPPTPIDSPGPTAIQAALHPPKGNWLYFVVTKSNGAESFSNTYPKQLANEHKARKSGVAG
jgi:UPF0755 protein